MSACEDRSTKPAAQFNVGDVLADPSGYRYLVIRDNDRTTILPGDGSIQSVIYIARANRGDGPKLSVVGHLSDLQKNGGAA